MIKAIRLRTGNVNPWAALILVLISVTVNAGEINGQAQVLDGDSLRIGDLEIRLFGIDAPESQQTCLIAEQKWHCGRSATRALTEMIGRAKVRCTWRERDTYDRALATCFSNGESLNAKLVALGMALSYTRYSKRYVPEQTQARAAAIGLWRSEFVAPWRWRRANATARRSRTAK